MIGNIDTIIRLLAVGASLLLIVLLLVGEARRGLKLPLAGLLLGAMAYLINSSPQFRSMFSWIAFADIASIFTPFFMWLFARRLFELEPPRIALWAIAGLMVASWIGGTFIPGAGQIGFYTIHLIALGLIADLLRVAFAGRSDDLIEKRRMIRLWLPILIALQAGGILAIETITGDAIQYPPVQFANAILILALTLFAGIALLRTDPELLVETESADQRKADASDLNASEQVLYDKLNEAMDDGYYRTPGLSITALAEHLGTPEHRLRALINQRLGYRNFSAFLNRHRVREASEILSDREKVDLPVLTIAMDLGYNSLPTFNRAFRAEKSTTPTDYRREQIAKTTDQN